MTEHRRRTFFERTILGRAGGALLLAADCERLWVHADELASAPARVGDDCWRLVQRGFRLEPGLVCLNNAPLGPGPDLVADAIHPAG